MSITHAYAVPHPPIIIPEIGRGEEEKINNTIKSYKTIADEIIKINPETIIISTPHSIIYSDYFHISPGSEARGNFSQFGHPEVKIEVKYDVEFIEGLSRLTDKAGTLGERNKSLDHGTMIPLYFIGDRLLETKIVRIGLSGYSLWEHYRMGMLIKQISEELNRHAVFIASGDMSHKLKHDGPYGYVKEGPEFDKRLCDILKTGDFSKLLDFSEDFSEKAAECGLRSFVMMAGALDGKEVESKMLSYEGPFGVGYGIFSYNVKGESDLRKYEEIYRTERRKHIIEDPFVKLAKETIENYVLEKSTEIPKTIPEIMRGKAGTFVSIHKEGLLRGCIGTISPTTNSVYEEIVRNAIEASTNDPRFNPVDKEELELLDISVDILGESEEVNSMNDLDPKKYGVIVSSGYKRGLLLPDLDGVDTIDAQVDIARRKAGIAPNEEIKIERFEVIRHC